MSLQEAKRRREREIIDVDTVKLSDVRRVDVAYACYFTHIIDYKMFFFMAPVDYENRPPLDEGELVIVGLRGMGKKRGAPRGEGCMDNCIIVDVNFMYKGEVVQPSIKMFKNYQHFCRCPEIGLCESLADSVCRILVATQKTAETSDGRMSLISASISHDDYLEDKESFIKWIGDNPENRRICTEELDHHKVKVTMAKYGLSLGTHINTTRLAEVFLSPDLKRRWTTTYDNALSLDLRVSCPSRSTSRESHRFTIYPTGRVAFSYQEIDDECQEVFSSLIDILRECLEYISTDSPDTRSTTNTPRRTKK